MNDDRVVNGCLINMIDTVFLGYGKTRMDKNATQNIKKNVSLDMARESHEKFQCKVGSIDTDSAANMIKMRS